MATTESPEHTEVLLLLRVLCALCGTSDPAAPLHDGDHGAHMYSSALYHLSHTVLQATADNK